MKTAILTPNPGVDRIVYLPTPARLGTLNRAERVVVSQGSKGANVAIMLRRFGRCPAYFTFTGGALGAFAESFTNDCGVDGRFIPTACGVRTNVKIIDSDGVCTEFNERGGPVTAAELAALEASVAAYAPDVAIINGSLPQGADDDTYARWVRRLNAAGCYTILDADGEPMRRALLERPQLIKPNVRELAGIVGADEQQLYEQTTLGEAMREVRGRYGCDVLCTLDSRGAACLTDDGLRHVAAHRVTLRGFSGAGDTFLAAYVHSRVLGGEPVERALALANAAAAAKVELSGTTLPQVDDVLRISMLFC